VTGAWADPDAALWRRLYVALAAVLALNYAWRFGFFLPSAHWLIDDDSRQFLAWSARLADPAALRGDLLADYWQSVTPQTFQWLLRALATVGIGPVLAAKLVPLALFVSTAVLAWKVALALTRHPMAAFCAAGLALLTLARADTLFTGTPRAFSAPLLLLFLCGLIRDRPLPTVAGIVLLGAIYPAPAVAAFGMLGLSRLRPPPRLFDWSGRTFALLGACAIGLAVAVLPFASSAGAFGPTIALHDAMGMPSMALPAGRSDIVDASGQVGWLCSKRIGFAPLPVPCSGPGDPLAWLLYALVVLPALALAWLWWRQRARPELARWNPTPVYALALASALVCYGIAAAVAFQLHLPSRYSQRLLEVVVPLALGHLIGMACVLAARRGKRRAVAVAMLGLILAFAATGAALKTGRPVKPEDAGALAFVAGLPPDSRIGGVSAQLESIPALTGRAVIATPEHAIPYHKGYFARIDTRLRASVAAVATDRADDVQAYARRWDVTLFAMDRSLLATGKLARGYATVAPDAVARAEADMARRPSLVQRRALACAVYAGPSLILADPACLAGGP
jgi:hypothetical protein